MNPYELKARFGNAVTLWGGLGSQSMIPFGRPSGIRAEIDRLRTEMGRDGGYVLAPAKSIPDETPLENAIAVYEGVTQGMDA